VTNGDISWNNLSLLTQTSVAATVKGGLLYLRSLRAAISTRRILSPSIGVSCDIGYLDYLQHMSTLLDMDGGKLLFGGTIGYATRVKRHGRLSLSPAWSTDPRLPTGVLRFCKML